ncbi:MAG: hypothetical protein H7318_13610 [Oligoflexus sp.]|nr:hypothetical protein [Oligoflexus sp.]
MPRNLDRIGRYFTCFGKTMGESTRIEVMTVDQEGLSENHFFNHATCDGQGALLEIQKIRGETEIELPQQRAESVPPLPRQLLLMTDYLKTMGQAATPSLKRIKSLKGLPNSSSYHSFSLDETNALLAFCKARNVSPTAFLTWTLHKAIGEQSGMIDQVCNWSIPVSIRAALSSPETTGNKSVPLFLSLDHKSSLEDIHGEVKNQLIMGRHWGAYRMLMLLGCLPNRIYEAVIRQDEAKMARKGQWFAILSNIGSVRGDENVAFKGCLAPTDPTAPIKGTSLTWNGRMTLGLSVHQSFFQYSLHADFLMKAWVRVIAQTYS